MDAIFFPAPADVTVIEDAQGGVITEGSLVLVDELKAEAPAQHLGNLLAITFYDPDKPSYLRNPKGAFHIRYASKPELNDGEVEVTATDKEILISSSSLAGYWRGTHLVVQLLGPDIATRLPSALTQIPFLPIKIQDFPSNPNRRMTLPLLHLASDIEDAKQVMNQLAGLGVNQLVITPPDANPSDLMPLPNGITVDEFDDFLNHAASLGLTVLPDHSGVTTSQDGQSEATPYPLTAIEQSLWPIAATQLSEAWVGERASKTTMVNGFDLDLSQRLGKYALLWSAQAIHFDLPTTITWPWHLARLQPTPTKDGQTLVALLLAPGTHAHGDHVEMLRGYEGEMGGGLKITAMVNGDPVPVTLTPGHPLNPDPTTGVYQVTIPTLSPSDDLRLAAIAQTDDGCSC